MAKPRIIVADTDVNYLAPIQLKFATDFFEKVDLEIISDGEYFSELFSTPQKADILVVSESLYSPNVLKHNIGHIFLMTEQYGEQAETQGVCLVYKYTSVKEIFNEITGKSADVLNIAEIKKPTQIVVVCSAAGGVGKTTVAMGVSAALTRSFKRVLYINAAELQFFQHMLGNKTPLTDKKIYAGLMQPSDSLYSDIKHVLRKEMFLYLPPFKAALMSLGLNFSVYLKIIEGAKQSGDYDFIIVDTETVFDENKAALLNAADKVVIVTTQSTAAVSSTGTLISNINWSGGDKYIVICNDFEKDSFNALILPELSDKFTVSEYIEHFRHIETLDPDGLASHSSVQRTAFLLM